MADKKSLWRICRCFTLIELLVVIAIIMTLMTLLFPAIGSVKAKCRAIECQSKLRQIGLAYGMYAADNREYFPPVYGYNPVYGGYWPPLSPGYFQSWWFYFLGPYAGKPEWEKYLRVSGTPTAREFIKSVFRCPSWPQEDPCHPGGVVNDWTTGYAPSAKIPPATNCMDDYKPGHLTLISSPGKKVLVVDSPSWAFQNSLLCYCRHNVNPNILFCDFHVKAFNGKYVQARMTSANELE